ncbi:hypothetical protein [Streptomyces sp. NPDC048442]|uniref:hypothetical protein n=1 Tax=Streptomyces sp. NPDC048442 TaxID=3154823 RepID=UPI00342D1360
MIIGAVVAMAVLAPLSADAAAPARDDGPQSVALLVQRSNVRWANALAYVWKEKGGFRIKGELIVAGKACGRLESVSPGVTGGTSEIKRVCKNSHGGERRVTFSRWTKRPAVRLVIEDRWLPDKHSESKGLHGVTEFPHHV